MHLPQLDPDEYGNARLHELLRRVHPDDVRAFVEKLTTQPLLPRLHTYRELLVGVHLRDRGFNFRYEHKFKGQTPDWSLVDDNKRPLEVIDVLTLHQRHEKDLEITKAVRTHGRWAGWITIPPDHISRKLSDKAGQYIELIRETQAPYVIAAYGEFTASLTPEEVQHVLFMQHGGWFSSALEISGVIYCREQDFRFEFTYFANPHALRRSSVMGR